MTATRAFRQAPHRRETDLDTVLDAHRARVNRVHRVRNAEDLVTMVDAFGFCFAFTHRTGDAAIPACFDHLSTNSEDRKWGWMWGWKDELPEEKRLYYGKLLVRKPTFVSMKMLPTFYATFGRAGEHDDHLDDVRAGRLSDIARRVIDYLAQHGETQTKRMRADLGITSPEGKADYAKAVRQGSRRGSRGLQLHLRPVRPTLPGDREESRAHRLERRDDDAAAPSARARGRRLDEAGEASLRMGR